MLWIDPPKRGPVTDEPPGRFVALSPVEVPKGEKAATYEFAILLEDRRR